MYFPTPKELAKVIADSSLTEEKKLRTLKAVQFMSNMQVALLYAKLIELAELDRNFISEVEQNDLKYKVEFQKAYEAAKEEERTS